eukprot:TRINITY_DN1961_c1_g2_i3.p2 TRINITY_DN1961_c1_g2~~TRINITY_DN1961_c1_g2_i3.p2  ORF type:complete len:153 (+),score=6.58 TRINITY_DN1961_c1_g2_i3:499-957(+)
MQRANQLCPKHGITSRRPTIGKSSSPKDTQAARRFTGIRPVDLEHGPAAAAGKKTKRGPKVVKVRDLGQARRHRTVLRFPDWWQTAPAVNLHGKNRTSSRQEIPRVRPSCCTPPKRLEFNSFEISLGHPGNASALGKRFVSPLCYNLIESSG